MNYWIFKVNPARYRINDRLRDPDPATTWLITRYAGEIAPGDLAFVWLTGPKRGICAVIQIDSYPRLMLEIDIERRYTVDLDTGERLRVNGTFLHRFACVSHMVLRQTPGLEKLSVFGGFQQATNFRVTRLEGEQLMRLVLQE